MRSSELLGRLQRHYIKPGENLPGGIFVPEVTLGGAGGSRADALFVGFTSTRGRYLYGHELKVSRADWRRELDAAHKADPWVAQCHAWYVVAPSVEIVPAEELPHRWGLLVVDPKTKTRLRTVVKADVDSTVCPSWEAQRSILSRLDTLRAGAVLDARVKANADAQGEVDKRVATRVQLELSKLGDVEAVRERLRVVEQALGVRLTPGDGDTWRDDDRTLAIGELERAAAFLRAHASVERATRQLASPYVDPLNSARQGLERLAGTLDRLRALAPDLEADA